MNKEMLEILLWQNLSTVKKFIGLMFDTIRKEIDTLKRENSDFKQSLLFMQEEVDDLKKSRELSNGTSFGNANNTSGRNLSEELRNLEDHYSHSNVIIDGLHESEEESDGGLQSRVENLLKEKLDDNLEM